MSAKIYAVIHARDEIEAHLNAHKSLFCGVDGLIFISHGELKSPKLINLIDNFEFKHFRRSKEAGNYNPNAKIGVNLLSERINDEIVDLVAGSVDILWSDYVPEGESLSRFMKRRDNVIYEFQFFGGVAFKYQPQPNDLIKAGQDARGIVDVLTTSGPGTGIAPDLKKIELLASGFGNKIAVASGVTPDNAVSMLPYVDYFLVSTGISKDFYTIDEEKCTKLVDVIRSSE